MAEKDITEKVLESYNDVFSDIVNVLLFEGKEVLEPDELEERTPHSYYKADDRMHEMERDVVKCWKMGNIRVACVGMENQTGADPDMTLRVIGYDGAEYRAQLLSGNKTKTRYPVITLVLYFGHEKRWNKPVRLLERLEVPEILRQFVNDYRINLFEIAFMTEQQVRLFRSDFRIVADYFVQKRKYGDYNPEPMEFTHVQETLQLLSVMTGDHRFEEICNDNREGGPHNMCEVLDRIENRGIQQGENTFAELMSMLFAQGRIEDAKRAAEDQEYRHMLIRELSLTRQT